MFDSCGRLSSRERLERCQGAGAALAQVDDGFRVVGSAKQVTD
jgi:hypothetical protein